MSLEALADVWCPAAGTRSGLRRVLGALLGRDVAGVIRRPAGRPVRRHAGFDNLADASIPVHFVATDLLSGRDVLKRGVSRDRGPASAAIPGVFLLVEPVASARRRCPCSACR